MGTRRGPERDSQDLVPACEPRRRGLVPPPASFENLLGGALFGACAILAATTTFLVPMRYGADAASAAPLGAGIAALHAAQALAAYRVRPSRWHGGFAAAYAPMLVLGGFYAWMWLRASAVVLGTAPPGLLPGSLSLVLAGVSLLIAPALLVGLVNSPHGGRLVFQVSVGGPFWLVGCVIVSGLFGALVA